MSRILDVSIPAWAASLESDDARYLAAHGGRGGGKSRYFAPRMIREHVRNPNSNSVCLREVQKSLDQSVKVDLVSAIRELGVEDYFEIQDARIRSRMGSGTIVFAGLATTTADAFKSYSGNDRAWVEEAQSLSRESLNVLLPTIRKPGSQIWFSWNPKNDTDPVDEFFRCNSQAAKDRGQAPPANAVVVEVNYEQNPWFGEPLLSEMLECQTRDIDDFNHIWRGQYLTASAARVFRNFKVEAFETPANATFYFGADWGFSVDPTALVRCFIDGRRLYVDYEAVEVGCEIVNTPALFLTIPDAEKWPITADPTRPETISALRKQGFNVHPAVRGPKSVEEGIEFLRGYEIVVHPRCPTLIKELLNFSYKVDPKTLRVIPEVDDRKVHVNVLDGLRYAVEGVRRLAQKKPVVTILEAPSSTNFWK